MSIRASLFFRLSERTNWKCAEVVVKNMSDQFCRWKQQVTPLRPVGRERFRMAVAYKSFFAIDWVPDSEFVFSLFSASRRLLREPIREILESERESDLTLYHTRYVFIKHLSHLFKSWHLSVCQWHIRGDELRGNAVTDTAVMRVEHYQCNQELMIERVPRDQRRYQCLPHEFKRNHCAEKRQCSVTRDCLCFTRWWGIDVSIATGKQDMGQKTMHKVNAIVMKEDKCETLSM